MSHLFKDRPDDLASAVKYIDDSLLQVALEVQMRHWFSATPSPAQVSAVLWPEITSDGTLSVRLSVGDDGIDLPSKAATGALFHSFEPDLSHEGLSIALLQLAHEWASEDTVVRMLSDAHARLTKEINQIHGVAA